MHPIIYSTFEDYLEGVSPNRVLEIGVTPNQNTLLTSDELPAAAEKVGVDIETRQHPDPEISLFNTDATDLNIFADGSFDCVVSNAVLEHEARFWEIVEEVRRVTTPGGTIILGGPAFTETGHRGGLLPSRVLEGRPILTKIHDVVSELYYLSKPERPNQTTTYGYHMVPHDYYRFSEYAVREIWMEGLSEVDLTEVMNPPRIVAKGVYEREG